MSNEGGYVSGDNVTDITPAVHACAVGMCPAVFKTDRGTLLIVGTNRGSGEGAPTVHGRVGSDEVVVEVPISLIRDLSPDALR